ncbi:hypothetical protein TvY486_0021850 [Trypanosoma vivax Y486]|uniref:Uncharacterized protein n=1 Tax=Trypanosoma vivax (strain Y486) TaxID=1055687 RepID=F9WPL0_TRYVY|nr:hypothetical protein TvY486_0021850 [Trypanosoma vivax Y486]|eukprot:CCD19487.1 hypothetical protein TvY486_0021850 [Trypanosoma vivax Y486]
MGEQISHCEEKATALLSADVGDETLLPNLGTCDVMANRILSCWRRYKARAVAKALRDQTARKGQLEQECQYKNIMACRLQRFFVVNYTRKCYKKSLKLHHEERRASSSCRANSKAPSFNDDSSPAAAVRERFDRMREKRKSMLRDHRDKTEVNAASSSSASQRESSLPTKSANHKSSSVIRSSNEQSVLKAHGVPRLHLSSSRLSTYSIENYRPESVTFSVSTLHRLMRAPKPLIYALCVMCDGYETRPETAFEILASSGWGASKGKIKNDEKHGKDKEKTDAAGEGKSESRRRAGSERSVKQSRKQKGERQKMDDDVVLELQSYSAVRHFLMHREADGVVSHGAASSPPCLPALFTYPLSPKVCSFVEKDEMRHYEPLTKSFSRPFEHWNVVLGLQRRIFTAAAVYAWKLIFSHTPHDDYKQRMLNTREEQEARLDRVEQRNRMILACYRVRSETEWLREASSDLNFVGYIWNPKRSLDPNDPDFERHCRETYEFVENFLYQCFPTLSNLDDVPTFLIGAGIFFLLQDTIAKVLKENEGSEQEHSTNKITSLFSSESDGVACPMDKQQRQAVFIYELLGLIDALSNWHDCQRGSKDDTIHKSKSASRHNNTGHLGDNITEWGTVLERSIRAVTSNSAIQLTTTRATNVGSELEGRDVASYSRRLRLVGVPSSNAAGTGEEFALVLPNGFLVELSERLCRCLIGVKLDLEVCEDLNTTA